MIGFSCCGVPAQIFKLLLEYCYVLTTSVCISSEFFFLRAKLIKNKTKNLRDFGNHVTVRPTARPVRTTGIPM